MFKAGYVELWKERSLHDKYVTQFSDNNVDKSDLGPELMLKTLSKVFQALSELLVLNYSQDECLVLGISFAIFFQTV